MIIKIDGLPLNCWPVTKFVTILLQKAKHAATDKKTGKSTSKSQFPLIYVHHAVTFVLCIGLWRFCSFLFVEHLLCVAYSPLEPTLSHTKESSDSLWCTVWIIFCRLLSEFYFYCVRTVHAVYCAICTIFGFTQNTLSWMPNFSNIDFV